MSNAIEASLIYGGDLSLMSNGDIALSQDIPNGIAQATFERALRIILTSPTVYDGRTPVSPPDDLFHPTFGSGVKTAIGEPYTNSLVQGIQSRISAALSSDQYIATNPPPKVVWTQLAIGTYQIVIKCTALTGEPLTLPSFKLTPFGVVVGS